MEILVRLDDVSVGILAGLRSLWPTASLEELASVMLIAYLAQIAAECQDLGGIEKVRDLATERISENLEMQEKFGVAMKRARTALGLL